MRFKERALVCMLICSPAYLHAGEFLATKNENPLLRALYLPLPADMGSANGAALSMSLSVANTINAEPRETESLFVDGEATTLRLAFDAPLAPRWRYRLTLPLIHDSGGRLDSLIDRWHGWFGLPRGQRPGSSHNQLRYSYSGESAVNVNASQTGLGDASAELGWYLLDDTSRSVSVWGGLEAPTGKASALTGDGAWDAGLWVHAVLGGARWQLGGEAGVLRPFGDDVFAGAARRTAMFGRAAATWRANADWSLRLQLDAQSARLKNTQLRFLGPSLQMSAGVEYRLNRCWSAQLGFSEDAAVNTAPDVTFFFGLRNVSTAH